MIDFYIGHGWTIIGPLLPEGIPAVRVQVIEDDGPIHMKRQWISLGDEYWREVQRINPEKIERNIQIHWGDRWKYQIVEGLLKLIQSSKRKDELDYMNAQDEIISWVLGRKPVLTVKEAEDHWKVVGIRTRIREGRFLPSEYWKSGTTWMLRISGMYRRYGWPDEP